MGNELEMLVREVQRLTSELEDVRGRLESYQRSRWMRLHPRFLVRRIRRSSTPVAPEATVATAHPGATGEDSLVARFREEVMERAAFSQDGFVHQIADWEPFFGELEGRRAELLEIGSYEGLSACYALWRLRDARVTCVDTFQGSVESIVDEIDRSTLANVFAANVAVVDGSRVRTLVGDSRRVLLDLVDAGERFALVYVDGSHLGLDVLVDTALAWQLVAEGGFLVWDDYRWKGLGEDPLLRPGVVIDAFLGVVEGKFELLRRDMQVVVRKLV
ncbi:MAG TPA: class I SAM-dependent methyltransferase [Gaiellaceae bacterium]|nr:class I SAM-dependent methyltransferase [Gaiellaceae bacterium]